MISLSVHDASNLTEPVRRLFPMFISIDGGDGCGKSTQVLLLAEWLRSSGRDVFTCRDPGTTSLGEAVRSILLHRDDLTISRESEMLLFMAARAQMVRELIRPALESGKIVVTDRFLLATIVYQGYAGGLSVEAVEQVGHVATGGILPDLNFVLDIPLETAEQRLDKRVKDRMEQMGQDYHERVRQGFLTHAKTDPRRYIVIDATQTIENVAAKIHNTVAEHFRLHKI